MITTIIFDWGGVVIKNPSQELLRYCAKYFHLPVETLRPVLQTYEPDFQKGVLSEQEFWNHICKDLHIPLPRTTSLWRDAFEHVYQEQPGIPTMIQNLKKKGYTIALLSNTELPSLTIFNDHTRHLFDLCVFSCNEGIIKPDPRIYTITLRKLQATPSQTVFVDDKPENVHTAAKLGMHAILFTTPQQLTETLQDILNIRSLSSSF